MHACEVIDVVGQRRPGIEQDRDRRDGGQGHKQRGDLPGAETDGLLWDRLSFAGENAEPAWRWCRWASPLCCAQPEKLTDINHFGLRAQALLHQSDGKNEVRASGHVAGWRVVD